MFLDVRMHPANYVDLMTAGSCREVQAALKKTCIKTKLRGYRIT